MFQVLLCANWLEMMLAITLVSWRTEKVSTLILLHCFSTVSCHGLISFFQKSQPKFPSFTVAPEWVKRPKSIEKITTGAGLPIHCSAIGEPRPTLTISKKHGRKNAQVWLLSSLAFIIFLSDSRWISVSVDHTLTLRKVSRLDAGHYRCRADNGLEPAIETDFQLLVSGMLSSVFECWELVLPATGSTLWLSVKMRRFLDSLVFICSPSLVSRRVPFKMISTTCLVFYFISIFRSVSSCE